MDLDAMVDGWALTVITSPVGIDCTGKRREPTGNGDEQRRGRAKIREVRRPSCMGQEYHTHDAGTRLSGMQHTGDIDVLNSCKQYCSLVGVHMQPAMGSRRRYHTVSCDLATMQRCDEMYLNARV